MVAINFMPQFEQPIISGTKIHTLRDKPRCEVGDTLQLYTGQRTKHCRLIKEVKCTAVVPVEFYFVTALRERSFEWVVDGNLLGWDMSVLFAKRDGFASPDEMAYWFLANKSSKWSGYLIAWGNAPYLPSGAR